MGALSNGVGLAVVALAVSLTETVLALLTVGARSRALSNVAISTAATVAIAGVVAGVVGGLSGLVVATLTAR